MSRTDDLISRADAIKAVTYPFIENLTYQERIMLVNRIPTADRPKGEWIDDEKSMADGCYFANCSECGLQIDVHENRGYYNFCPNCGADMRGEGDDR